MDTTRIAYAADELIRAKSELADALRYEAGARFAIEAAEATAIATGSVTGKNEAERKANLFRMLEVNYTSLHDFEADTARARYWHDAQMIRWEQIKLELRAEELAAREAGDGRGDPGAD